MSKFSIDDIGEELDDFLRKEFIILNSDIPNCDIFDVVCAISDLMDILGHEYCEKIIEIAQNSLPWFKERLTKDKIDQYMLLK